ncbi:MAG: trans-sulfuration enzyme family protein [Candidatus Cryptobacteroides sp.]
MKQRTKAIHLSYRHPDAYGALNMPVYHTVAYEFPNAEYMADVFCGRVDEPDYSRVTNPTVTYYEDKVREITGASAVYAFSSGMAAISNTLMALASAGKNIVASNHMFGNTWLLITETLKRFGVSARMCDLTNLEEVRAAVDADTCCIYAEIISNPHMEVADLKELAKIAHEAGIPLVADSTMIPFTEFSASSLGVDVELVSSTKYISGGGTCVGGLAIDYGTVPGFKAEMKGLLLNLGAYMTPQVAYMQTLGLENLDVRYKAQAASALYIARKLREVPAVRRVNYVGLEDNPYHEIARRQFGPTAGAMVTIDLEDKAACFRFLDNLKLVFRATNLFDNRTLAIHPASTIFGNFTPERLRELDIFDTTIRLSIGLEDPDDLLEDMIQALDNL